MALAFVENVLDTFVFYQSKLLNGLKILLPIQFVYLPRSRQFVTDGKNTVSPRWRGNVFRNPDGADLFLKSAPISNTTTHIITLTLSFLFFIKQKHSLTLIFMLYTVGFLYLLNHEKNNTTHTIVYTLYTRYTNR